MTAPILPRATLRIAALDAAYVVRCAKEPGIGAVPRPVVWSPDQRDSDVRQPEAPGKHLDAYQRAAVVQLANDVGARRAAEIAGVSERAVARWRSGVTKKVAR